jgi:hypothetical protein
MKISNVGLAAISVFAVAASPAYAFLGLGEFNPTAARVILAQQANAPLSEVTVYDGHIGYSTSRFKGRTRSGEWSCEGDDTLKHVACEKISKAMPDSSNQAVSPSSVQPGENNRTIADMVSSRLHVPKDKFSITRITSAGFASGAKWAYVTMSNGSKRKCLVDKYEADCDEEDSVLTGK